MKKIRERFSRVADKSSDDLPGADAGGAGNPGDDLGDEFAKAIIQNVITNNVAISDDLLSDVLGIGTEELAQLRREVRSTVVDDGDGAPKSWDYVFVFDAGDPEKKRTPTRKEKPPDDMKGFEAEWENGMSQVKYYNQIVLQTEQDLNYARLDTKKFRSRDGKLVFIVVGISEKNLRYWADKRDTDLLLDPVAACLEGRKSNFPLALRTYIDSGDSQLEALADRVADEKSFWDELFCIKAVHRGPLPIQNWQSMYVKYSPSVNQEIYKSYHRISGDKSSPKTPFSEKIRLRLMYEAINGDKGEGGAEIEIQDHILSRKHPMLACFPLHDQKVLDEFEMDWLNNHSARRWLWIPLRRIRRYFGEPIAFYFAFLGFYMKWLMWPSLIGIIFFLIQLAIGEIDINGIFLLPLFIIFWCVAFVDFWYRHEARLRLRWGMTKFEEKAVARPQFKGEWIHNNITGLWAEDYSWILRGLKSTATYGFIGAFMIGCVAAVLNVLVLRDGDPDNILKLVGYGVLNGVMIAIFDMLYKRFAVYGNEWENHRTEQDFQNALINKAFIFKFFNSFSSLFYLSFVRVLFTGTGYYIVNFTEGGTRQVCGDCWDPDINDFKGTNDDGTCEAGSTCAIVNAECNSDKLDSSNDYKRATCCLNTIEQCSTARVDREINDIILFDLRIQLAALFVTAILIQNTLEVGFPILFERIKLWWEAKQAAEEQREVEPKSEAEEQYAKAPYPDTIDDMSEIIIQFGYVTLFVMALPITPLLALVNNIIELKVDGYNLVKSSQRPHPNGSYGLGAWNSILGFFSLVAVGTNVALLTWRTDTVSRMLGDDPENKWVFFAATSFLLALLISIEKALIPDIPLDVLQGIERQRHIENVLIQGASSELDSDESPKSPEDDDEEFPFEPTKDFFETESVPLIPLGNLSQLEESADTLA